VVGADLAEARVAGREKRRMPAEQALPRQRRRTVDGGVEHHLDHALDVPAHRRQQTDLDTQAACDG
jgi:hypothetical protein